VRVAADQLLAAVIGNSGQVAGAPLLKQQRQEVDLEEDVAELVEQLLIVAAVGGVGELVCLLDCVRDDRPLVLLAVPRTFDPEPARDPVQTAERVDSSVRRAQGLVVAVPVVAVVLVVFGAL
jgi:hypothetical protein